MAHSPEGHYTFESAGGESASFESRTDISFDMWESDFRIDNGYVLRMRLAELDLIDSPAPSVVMPGEDKGAHPKLFAGKYIGPGMLAYHDIRRILLTYENTNGSVTAHDWLVDLAVGACLVIETNREKDKLPSVASGPMMYFDTFRNQLWLSEGAQYLEDATAIFPAHLEPDATNVTDFLADTRPFLGGRAIHLDMRNPNAFTYKPISC